MFKIGFQYNCLENINIKSPLFSQNFRTLLFLTHLPHFSSGKNESDFFFNLKLTLTYQNLFFIKYMPTLMRHIFLLKKYSYFNSSFIAKIKMCLRPTKYLFNQIL